MNRTFLGLIALSAALISVARGQTDTISTSESFAVTPWGPVGSNGYGQTITAPTGYNDLESFTFSGVSSQSNSSFNYQTYIYAFNPNTSTEVGSALYVSGVQTVPASGFVTSSISPNLTLAAGQTYLVLVTANGVSQTNNNAFGNLYVSSGSYSGGNFYFINNPLTNGFSSSAWNQDNESAFTAVFGIAVNPSFSLQGLTANQQAVLIPINQGMANGNSQAHFTALVNALLPISGNPASLGTALNQLSPQAFGQFTTQTAFNNASFETEAVDNYLAGQRGADGAFLGGNGAIDASGLTVNDPDYDPNLSMIHSRLLAWNPAPAHGVVSDVAAPLLGGVDLKQEADPNSLGPRTNSHPWNVYVTGSVVLGQGSSSANVPHFDDTSSSVVLGVDYRITSHFLVGLTAGYGHTDATLDEDGSSATVDSYSAGLYASYADQGWYADVSGDYVHNVYTQDRVIGFLGETAHSAPDGNEGVGNLDGGYDFHRGSLTFGPLAGVQYTHLSVDGYNESGSVADLSVNREDSDSLRSRLGGRVSYAFSQSGVNFTPHLDASWQHEFLDQSRGVTSQFTGQGLGSFSIRTDNPSRDSALVDAGVDAALNDTVLLFADYEV